MSKIKGTGVLAAFNYIKREFGNESLDKLLKALEPADQEIFANPIVVVSWYDYPAFVRMTLKADVLFGKNDYALPRAIGNFNAEEDIRGVYKIFAKLLTTQYLLGKSAQLWHQILDHGKMVVAESKPRHARLNVLDFPDIPLHHEFGSLGYIERLLLLCQRKNPIGTHPKCIARGDNACCFEFRWDD